MSEKNSRWSRQELVTSLCFYAALSDQERMTIPKSSMDVMLEALPLRTKASLKMRIANFIAVDPEMKKLGHKGLDGGGDQVGQIWQEFSDEVGSLNLKKVLRAKIFDLRLESIADLP